MCGDIEYSAPLRGLINEKIITGTNGRSIVPCRDIPRFIDLMMMDELPFDRITDRFYPLEGIMRAFTDLETHQYSRATILFEHQ